MWRVIYHPKIEKDLEILGAVEARRILAAIRERIIQGEPDKIGKLLNGELAGCRRIRVGSTRIVYKVYKEKIEVFVIAVVVSEGMISSTQWLKKESKKSIAGVYKG